MINVAMFKTVLQSALQVTAINKTPNKINIRITGMNLKWDIKRSTSRIEHKLATMARQQRGILRSDWNLFWISGYWTAKMQRAEEEAAWGEIIQWGEDGAGSQSEPPRLSVKS